MSRCNRWIGTCDWIGAGAARVEQQIDGVAGQARRGADVRARFDTRERRQLHSGVVVERPAREPHVRVGRVDLQRGLADLQMRDRRFGFVRIRRIGDRPPRQPLAKRLERGACNADRRAAALMVSTAASG